MDGGCIPLILIFIFFIIWGAYFSCSESSFASMNKIRIKSKADDGDKKAKNAMYISNNFDKALSTVLIGNNIVNNASASVATLLVARLWSDSGNYEVISTIVTAFIIFMFSDMIPKRLANDRHNTMALRCAGLLRVLMKVFAPLNALMTAISSLFLKLFSANDTPSITEDELYDIIDTAEEEGVMDEKQSDLFKSALDFSDTRIGDVMTVREDIEAVSIDTPSNELLEFIKNCSHSRIPVYRKTVDDIVGILPVRSYLREYVRLGGHSGAAVDVKKLLIRAAYVSKNAKADDVLEEMRKGAAYLAIVKDDENRTLGVVTIEDFLEELVGEIWDEEDVVDDNFVKLGGNRFKVNAKMTVGEAFGRIGYSCDDTRILTSPVSVWVISKFGGVPDEDEEFEYGNLTVTVDKVEENRVVSVIIKYMTDEEKLEEQKLRELEASADQKADGESDSDSGDDENDEPVLKLAPGSDGREEDE